MDNYTVYYKLWSHLVDTQEAVIDCKPATAKMSLMAAEGVLELVYRDYSDVRRMYNAAGLLKENVYGLMKFSDSREVLVDKLEEMIGECCLWLTALKRVA